MDHTKNYGRLLLMFALHLVAMYVLMYAMVNTAANALPNHNQLYMAALMASPMLILELWLMKSMYPNKKWNLVLIAFGILLLATSYLFIREQTAIGDEQFLRSMIPHHAGAILMCEKADLTDPQIHELCANILSGQQAEIDWMKAKLESIEPR
ncbi:MAG: DUF305 domain-containing protein [Patescibacteria group bacterium]